MSASPVSAIRFPTALMKLMSKCILPSLTRNVDGGNKEESAH